MDYASLDIETTGLIPDQHQILEIAYVIDGSSYYHLPLSQLQTYTTLIKHHSYCVSELAAIMHAKNGLWEDLSQIGYYNSTSLMIEEIFRQIHLSLGNEILLAGKNIANFDMPFLAKKSNGMLNPDTWIGKGNLVDFRVNRRTLDVGPMFATPDMKKPPSTEECCQIAKIPTSANHRALADAYQIAALIRERFNVLHDEDYDFLNAQNTKKDIVVFDKRETVYSVIEESGDQFFFKNKYYHRDNDLPAVIYADGTQYWYQNGRFHRDNDKPAIIAKNGSQHWCQHDKLHRDNDLPAIIYSDGSQFWYQNGELHRNGDLPAIISVDGTQKWYQHDKLHRDNDQPAVVYPDGHQEWWQHGIKIKETNNV